MPMGITQYRLAKDIHAAGSQISHLVHGRIGISAAMAVEFEAYSTTTSQRPG